MIRHDMQVEEVPFSPMLVTAFEAVVSPTPKHGAATGTYVRPTTEVAVLMYCSVS